MILDKLLFEQIGPVGKSIMKKAGLSEPPKNIEQMSIFLSKTDELIKANDFDGIIVGKILYSFISSVFVRDRNTTSRTFEDVFSGLFGTHSTDVTRRTNPVPPKDLLNYDKLCQGLQWKISSDLSSNKREKPDVFLNDYAISLKTLKGYAYDENDQEMEHTIAINGNEITNNENREVNMGSFSYRALFKGVLTDQDLDLLGDRRGGLGSRRQIRTCVLNKIKAYGKKNEFVQRLELFLKFVYSDDIYIILKSNYLITWFLIPSSSFTNVLVETYKKDEGHFENIWQRWENNNLRMSWRNMLKKMKEYNLNYYQIDMFLGGIVRSEEMKLFEGDVSEYIKKKIDEMLADNKKN